MPLTYINNALDILYIERAHAREILKHTNKRPDGCCTGQSDKACKGNKCADNARKNCGNHIERVQRFQGESVPISHGNKRKLHRKNTGVTSKNTEVSK